MRYRPFWKIDLVLKPAFLGGIMKESGNRPPMMVPNKAVYMHQDLTIGAKFFQVPLKPISVSSCRFPVY
jgi:glutathione S-transferase kappa 1